MSIRLFHWVFSHFTLLQISKSLKTMESSLSRTSIVIPLATLMICSTMVQLTRGHCPFAAGGMYLSFLLVSLVDGSLSNHVVTSNLLALLALSCMHRHGQLRKAVNWFTAVLYLVTGIHKLNSGFVDPVHSCAALYLSGSLSMLPTWILSNELVNPFVGFVLNSAPIGAILFELGMPIILLWSSCTPSSNFRMKCRKLALLVGASFHAILALSPSPLSVYPFSAIMIPLYVMLVPEECKVAERTMRFSRTVWAKAIVVVILALGHQHGAKILFNEPDLFEYPNYGLWGVFLVWNLIGWSIIIGSLLKSLMSKQEGVVPDRNPIALQPLPRLLILALFIFGLTPYVGLRNYPALAMFSNLRTEGKNPNTWNFLSLDLFEYQKDYVTVTNTDMEAIADLQINLGNLFPEQLKQTNDLLKVSNEFYICPPRWPHPNPDPAFKPFSIPFIELRRRIAHLDWSTHAPVFVEYTRHYPDGRSEPAMFDSSKSHQNDEIMRKLSMFEEYFVKFRSFSDEFSPCRH